MIDYEIENFNQDNLENIIHHLDKINSNDNYNCNDNREKWDDNEQNLPMLNDTLEYQDNLDYDTFNQIHYNHINNYFDLLSKNLSENYHCDSNQQDFVFDDEEQNPIVPGLFPAMNINDPDKFLQFDMLPITPSFVHSSN